VCHVRVRNSNLRDIGDFQEIAVYHPHHANPGWTTYQSRITFRGATWIGRQLVALAPGSAGPLLEGHITTLEARLRESHKRA